jgi:Transposase IS116/IS110/IS902 family
MAKPGASRHAYLGLVPREYSSGTARVQGGVTKTGTGHARRLLVEAAWHHRSTYRPRRDLRRRWDASTVAARQRGHAANHRLHTRWASFDQRRRQSEVAEIEAALRAHRLVTLTGVGGVGKTRLAVEVASQLADEFPDGVRVFELAAVADSAAVPDAVAAVLDNTQQPGKSVAESVATALEGRVR